MLPIESVCLQRAIFGACQTNAATVAAAYRRPTPERLAAGQPPWLMRAGVGGAGVRRTAGNRRARGFLLLDKTVSDGLTSGQCPAVARVLADLVHLAAR